MKKILILNLLFLSVVSSFAQQDPQYNLYQFNQMIINPAYAGARDGIATIASVRQQWAGFDGAPRTICVSAHSPILENKMGVGLTIVNDQMGPRTVSGVYGNAAYIMKLGQKFKLSLGINAGYNSYRFNFDKLTFKTPETSTQISQNQKAGKLDFNSGAFLKSNKFFLGFSATHLAAGDVYSYDAGTGVLSYRLRTHIFLTMGRSFVLDENCVFAPTIMYRSVNNSSYLDINFNFFLLKKIWLGAFVRGGYGPGFLMQYYITPKLRVAYSYDSGLKDKRNLGASHEVMIGFDLPEPKSKVISPRFL